MRDTRQTGDDAAPPRADRRSGDAPAPARPARRGLLTLDRSPLARKIIVFNLIGLLILIAGVFYLNPFRDSLAAQRSAALQAEARLIADVLALQLPTGATHLRAGPAPLDTLDRLSLSQGVEIHLFDAGAPPDAAPLARLRSARTAPPVDNGNTLITDALNAAWEGMSRLVARAPSETGPRDSDALARSLIAGALAGNATSGAGTGANGDTLFAAAAPVRAGAQVLGVVTVTSAAGEIDALVRAEREEVLQVFVVAILVSIGLSLVLASTIANPLADLATAAEVGRDRNARHLRPSRVRIPDLSARPDEIGRLSAALRGMVTALYDRIDANEQFAADVAHEIKNPLASLRSAVGTLRIARRDDQREKLLDVIDHDVRRLDRLVSDISNASRLDSELVKEEEARFDLLGMLTNLSAFLSEDAHARGVDFITDLPRGPMQIVGLEARLAQVFVNLITNATSFCTRGDAVRIWVRRRENRVLIVVEDTGPGIPEEALGKVFDRFYSERPEGQFGDHSGLGLAISRQIVEAHGGVIWAENIRPTAADPTSEPLGARFVVGLPV